MAEPVRGGPGAEGKPVLRHRLTGICPPARGAAVADAIRSHPAAVWLVTTEEARDAERLAEDVALFRGSDPFETLVFPESMADSRDMRAAFAAASDRLAVLSRLRSLRQAPSGPGSAPLVVVTTPAALSQPVPAFEQFSKRELTLTAGRRQPFGELLQLLRELDYDAEAVCEAPGSYAVRGGIIDVYPVTATQPYRLDFLGDDLEEIRAFDPVTQRSGGKVESITVPASPSVSIGPAATGLADYLPGTSALALIEPASIEASFSPEPGGGPSPLEPLLRKCRILFGIGDLDESSSLLAGASESTWDTESLVHHRRYPDESLPAADRLAAEEAARGDFLSRVAAWRASGHAIVCVAAKEGEEQRMREILEADGRIGSPQFLRGALNEGFRIGGRLVAVTETEVFGRQRPRRPSPRARAAAQRAQVDQLLDFSELVEGDFVVHLQHGVALFRGLKTLDTAQGAREVISLEFDDAVTLHIPLSESHLISRYVGLGRTRPKLGKIGSNRWDKVRGAAERATLDLAAELLAIQAKREAEPGSACPPDNAWQKEFEASFAFAETADQLRAIRETKADMERARPMDRLICGDVGFGKTEVAIRAAFKAVQAGRQVAVLVPTTVLAQQHLNTFRERMAGYPIAVEMLSRFRSRAEHAQVLSDAESGRVDILIGTHRLLQPDVRFRDLGLVVVDEEQRFGVKHKEAFKRLRETVDILSLSATPIPRTLYLALTGARDLSVIETPPADRHPIQTIVRTYDESIVVEAVRHEIRRGGQVFYLHNRVATIAGVAARLGQLLPGVRIGVGHGRMDADALEQVMTDFVAGTHQVLVCTTIIESGLDIPNCNTIIIEGADRFGLAQLYQLRGRVGRFRHQAYAYLLLHRHTRVLDIARRRLAALRQHNHPGAGFRIAMRDLELRGAGNLLGSEQSGHIAGVGFELYCQLLRQSIARLRGDTAAAAVRATVKLDFVFVGEGTDRANSGGLGRKEDGYTALKDAETASAQAVETVSARLPSSYIAESRLRIDFYRRLALAAGLPDLKQVEADLRDRFGKYGPEVRALLLLTEIRLRAEQKGVVHVETESNRLKCLRNSGRRDDWVMRGARFPRLTAPRALLRLREIIHFLNRLPEPTR
jgi:transcription-repair coupling factor (superfamily II helicase)